MGCTAPVILEIRKESAQSSKCASWHRRAIYREFFHCEISKLVPTLFAVPYPSKEDARVQKVSTLATVPSPSLLAISEHIDEHKKIHDGLDRYSEYLDRFSGKQSLSEYDPEELRGVMDSFKEVLSVHRKTFLYLKLNQRQILPS